MFTILSYMFRILSYVFRILSYVFRNLSYMFRILSCVLILLSNQSAFTCREHTKKPILSMVEGIGIISNIWLDH